MYLSQNIKHLRKGKRLSQEELGNVIGVSSAQIGSYESGKSFPRFEGLLKLTEFFDVKIDDMIHKNLMVEEARSADPTPANEEEAEELLGMVNELLYKRVLQLEEEIKRTDPERAKDLGIK